LFFFWGGFFFCFFFFLGVDSPPSSWRARRTHLFPPLPFFSPELSANDKSPQRLPRIVISFLLVARRAAGLSFPAARALPLDFRCADMLSFFLNRRSLLFFFRPRRAVTRAHSFFLPCASSALPLPFFSLFSEIGVTDSDFRQQHLFFPDASHFFLAR